MVAGRADGVGEAQVTESMKRTSLLMAGACFLLFLTLGAPVIGQDRPQESSSLECTVSIYLGKDLDQKPQILAKPAPSLSRDEHKKYESQVITLRAILCGSGTVTDITVKNGVSNAVDAKAIEAARKIKFTPGRKDGQNVSRFVTLIYRL